MSKMSILAIVLAVIIIPAVVLGILKSRENKSANGSTADSAAASASIPAASSTPSVSTTPSDSTSPSTSTLPSATAPATPLIDPAAKPGTTADTAMATKVKLSTDRGDIVLDLYPQDAPLAVQNFVTLGKRGYYNNVIFHRVIKDFMIQAGDPQGTGMGGESIYGPTFKTEINSHKFVLGALGAARTTQMDTNGSQFFILSADSYPSLDGQYTVFGQAEADSISVVQAIDAVPTDSSNDKPLTDVKITGFTILE